MSIFLKIFAFLMIIAVLCVYVITPSVNNGISGPYHTVKYTTKKRVIQKENDDWKYKDFN